MTNHLTILLACIFVITTCLNCVGQETAKATKGELDVTVNLPGIFVADDKDEIKMEPSKYSGDLIITKILAEGVNVKEGDVLVEFDTDKVDEAIEEAENEATDAEVELKKAQAEHQTAQIDLEAKQAQLQSELAALEREVQAAIAKQVLEFAEKEQDIANSEYQLENTRIDLETLKKIYAERNLTTSNSGDILIERELLRIENGEKNIDYQKKQLAYYRQFDKSKTQLEKELEVEKKKAEIKKQKVTLEAAVAEKKGLVDKAQRKYDTANKKVEGLKQDRDQLQVVSPRDGVLFYGQTGQEMPAGVVIIGGSMPDIRKELRIGGRVKTHQILLTVATMDSLSIKMTVSEDDIQHLAKDLKISVFPVAFPTLEFDGVLTKVDQVATKPHFTSTIRRFNVRGKCTDKTPQLRSGMNCRVAIHAITKSDVVLVPVNGVFKQGDQFVCYVVNGSSFDQREVEIGLSNANHVEILSGLNEGETISLKRPKE